MKEKTLLILLSAILVLAACKGKSTGDYEFVNNQNQSSSSATDSAITDSGQLATKLVKTAGINFKVKDVQQTSEHISALTKQYGGMVMHHQIQSVAGQNRDVHVSNDSLMRISAYSTQAEMTVKVPSNKLEDFMAQVRRLGIYINSSRMDIEDRTLDYLSSRLKLKDRQELVAQQKKGKIKIKDPANVLLLKDDMVDQQISNMRTDDAVKFSIVNLSFYQNSTILKEMISNDDPTAYNIPWFQRIGLAFASGWAIFVDVLIVVVNLWVFILAVLGIWLGWRYYQKHKARITNHSGI
jgi:hypothetical protein